MSQRLARKICGLALPPERVFRHTSKVGLFPKTSAADAAQLVESSALVSSVSDFPERLIFGMRPSAPRPTRLQTLTAPTPSSSVEVASIPLDQAMKELFRALHPADVLAFFEGLGLSEEISAGRVRCANCGD